MYIIPIFRVPLKGDSSQVWLFLERNATHLIEIPQGTAEVEYAADFVKENGFRLKSDQPLVSVDGRYIFLLVDGADPGLADFYTWREIVPGSTPPKEGWRPFIWSKEDNGLNRFLEEITLGGNAAHTDTAFSVLDAAIRVLP